MRSTGEARRLSPRYPYISESIRIACGTWRAAVALRRARREVWIHLLPVSRCGWRRVSDGWCGRGTRAHLGLLRGLAGEEVRVAGFFGSRLARKNSRQRWLALGQAVERGDHIFESFKMVHAIGAAAEFSGRLRAAKQQDADDGDLAAVEIEDLLQAVLELRHAAVGAAGGSGEALFLQGRESVANCRFVERHHRLAIVLLIAGIDQRVQRERVVVRRGDVFFDQRAEDAGFDFGKDHGSIWHVILIQSDPNCGEGRSFTTGCTEAHGGSQKPHPCRTNPRQEWGWSL